MSSRGGGDLGTDREGKLIYIALTEDEIARVNQRSATAVLCPKCEAKKFFMCITAEHLLVIYCECGHRLIETRVDLRKT